MKKQLITIYTVKEQLHTSLKLAWFNYFSVVAATGWYVQLYIILVYIQSINLLNYLPCNYSTHLIKSNRLEKVKSVLLETAGYVKPDGRQHNSMLTEIAVFTYMLAKRKPRDVKNAILPTRNTKTNCSLWIFKAIWLKYTSEFVQGNYFEVEPSSDIVSLQLIYTPRHGPYFSRDVHCIHCMSLAHPTKQF